MLECYFAEVLLVSANSLPFYFTSMRSCGLIAATMWLILSPNPKKESRLLCTYTVVYSAHCVKQCNNTLFGITCTTLISVHSESAIPSLKPLNATRYLEVCHPAEIFLVKGERCCDMLHDLPAERVAYRKGTSSIS